MGMPKSFSIHFPPVHLCSLFPVDSLVMSVTGSWGLLPSHESLGTLYLKEIRNFCIQKVSQTVLKSNKRELSEHRAWPSSTYFCLQKNTIPCIQYTHNFVGIIFSCFPNSYKQTWPKKPDAPSPPPPPPPLHTLQLSLLFHVQQYTLAKKESFKNGKGKDKNANPKPNFFYILCICNAFPNEK